LIDDAVMPPSRFLPGELQSLSLRNAGRIGADTFHVDIAPLIARLDKENVKHRLGKKGR